MAKAEDPVFAELAVAVRARADLIKRLLEGSQASFVPSVKVELLAEARAVWDQLKAGDGGAIKLLNAEAIEASFTALAANYLALGYHGDQFRTWLRPGGHRAASCR